MYQHRWFLFQFIPSSCCCRLVVVVVVLDVCLRLLALLNAASRKFLFFYLCHHLCCLSFLDQVRACVLWLLFADQTSSFPSSYSSSSSSSSSDSASSSQVSQLFTYARTKLPSAPVKMFMNSKQLITWKRAFPLPGKVSLTSSFHCRNACSSMMSNS